MSYGADRSRSGILTYWALGDRRPRCRAAILALVMLAAALLSGRGRSAAAAATVAELAQAVAAPGVSVEKAAGGKLRVVAKLVSIHEVFGAIEAHANVKFRVATGVWGRVWYESKAPDVLPSLLGKLGKRYGLRIRRVVAVKPGGRPTYDVSPADAKQYFSTDDEFFRAHRRARPPARAATGGIATGSFYVNGHLVKPPYSVAVSRDKRVKDCYQVAINGVVVHRVRSPKADPIIDPGDIPVPPGGKTIMQGNVTSLMVRKYQFWVKTHGRQEARKRLEQFLGEFPPIKEFTFGPKGGYVTLVSKKGERHMLMLGGPRRAQPLSEQQLKDRVGKEAEFFGSCLRRGGAVLQFGTSAQVFMPADAARQLRETMRFIQGSGFDRRLKLDLLAGFGLGSGESATFLANYEDGSTERAKESRGLEGGFFFSQGRYVPPPYEVAVVNYAVLLNGKYILFNGGAPRKPVVGIPKDPGEFKWTEAKRKQRLAATGFAEHASKRLEYWALKHGFAEGWKKFVQYYKAQPTVKEVVVEKEGSIYVRDVFGDGYGTGFLGGHSSFKAAMKRKYAASEREARQRHEQAIATVNQLLNQRCKRYQQSLDRGSAILSFNPGGGAIFTMSPGTAKGALNQIGNILRSTKSKKEKLELLKGFHPHPRFAAQILANWDGVWPVVKTEHK